MPNGIYSNLSCNTQRENDFISQPHQIHVLNSFLNSPYKGMLLYHKLGSGKSCTSIKIADKMLKRKLINHVYLFTPGSLRQTWITEYCAVCGKSSENLFENYTFLTYNYGIGKFIPDLNNSLVIIDEVHNLINGVKNFSKQFTEIYNKILFSNCKVLALSGTPIFNYVYEFALLGQLLKPSLFPEIRESKDKENNELMHEKFMSLFIIDSTGELKPRNELEMKHLLEGIISYHPGNEAEMPEIIYHEPIKCKMSIEQEDAYIKKMVQENSMKFPPSKKLMHQDKQLYDLLKQLYILAKKNLLTREAVNFWYSGKKILLPDLPLSQGGWINPEKIAKGKLKTYSPKFCELFKNIIKHIDEKHVIFTFFKQKYGVVLINSLLSSCGIKCAVFSGDLNDSQRKSVIARFNSVKNRKGDDIKVLLLTEAGAEGISLLECKHFHILESTPRINKTIQAIGRVARYKSHSSLKKEDRIVNVWRYWSVGRKENVNIKVEYYTSKGEYKTKVMDMNLNDTIDAILYKKGEKDMKTMDSFLKILQKNSV